MRARWTALAVAVAIVVVPAAAGADAAQLVPATTAPITSTPPAGTAGDPGVALPAPTAADTASADAEPEATHAVRPGTTAAPVNPAATTLVQPDGTTFSATAWGDGTSHGYQDASGYTVTRRADGTWVYATAVDRGGDLVAGRSAAGSSAPPAGTDTQLRPEPAAAAPSADADAEKAAADGATTNAVRVPHDGPAPTVVILAKFTDQTSATTPAQWATRYFGSGYGIADFYDKASYGNLDLTPATETSGTNDGIVGWVSVGTKHPNTADFTDAVYAVATNAIKAANPYVDFGSYDANHDGAIDSHELHVVVIAAGYEASFDSYAPCGKMLWGHRGALYGSQVPTVDGVKVGSFDGDGGYQMFGERHCSNNDPGASHQATMGIMAHEFGHDLGLPDLYAYGVEGGDTGEFSLMAYGSWLTTGTAPLGSSPALPDAFSRVYEGWVTPTVVQGAGQVVSIPAATEPVAPKVVQVLPNPNGIDWASGISGNQPGTGEYFLIENRTQTGYDGGLPGCGILIWHIDESQSPDWPNSSTTRFLVGLEQADGNGDLASGDNRGDDGDPFPGSEGNTSFTNLTNPNSRRYNGSATSVSVTVPAGACAASKSITVSSPSSYVPVNDAFASPTVLNGTSGRVASSSTQATKEAGEPAHADNPGGASVWYSWTAPASGTLSIDMTNTGFDSTLAVYTGSAVGSLQPIASDDDDSWYTSALWGVSVTGGTTYRIAVDGFNDTIRIPQGSLEFTWTFDGGTSPDPFASWAKLIDRQYLDLKGALPTTATRNNWIARMTAKGSDQYQLVSDLRGTTDNTTNVDPVARLYRAYFLRDPDPGGFSYWISKRRNGSSLNGISSTFAGSSEFKRAYGPLSNHAFVALVYQNVLGRPGEASGVAYWTGQLDAHKKTRGQVMVGFSESSEYIRTQKVPINLSVATLLMLGRTPYPNELAYWTAQDHLGRFSNVALARWVFHLPDYRGTIS
ncbi:M6 family metalloprotease domain-containing protein [Aquihabitans sp. McL0605]|uniref:M6 family metalloprotease domain-containing protein n=1 Tax=Aquihabitans sp. McL0605 TaxID=3415671 RepID=UPI003CF64F73